LAGKISDGVGLERIMDDIRDEAIEEFSTFSFLTKQHLRNIRRDFNLHRGRHHSSDATSVQLFVDSMMNLEPETNPVLFYKPQGKEDLLAGLKKDDFFLIIMTNFQKKMLEQFGKDKICIDSTHGVNAYDFELTTLLVVDEFGAGCPGAFCLTNRKDSAAWELFYSQVRGAVGTITADVFMSDDDPAFYNAWERVMGAAQRRLLCTWHVDKNWRKNLHEKVHSTREEKAMIYKALRVLLQETNPEQFVTTLQQFIHELLSDESTNEFGRYFQKTYASRTDMWAYCYRVGAGINTNMYLESLHKTFKHFYLQGKKNKRLDNCIYALMRFTRDKVFERLIKVTKKKPTQRIERIFASHRKCVEVTEILEIEKDATWEATSSANSEIKYIVSKKSSPTCKNMCEFTCKVCGICIHMFDCNCVDNVIKFNICKHIHACVQKYFSMRTIQSNQEEPNQEFNEQELLAAVQVHNSIQGQVENPVALMIEKLNAVVGNLSSCEMSEGNAKIIGKKIDELVTLTRKFKRRPDFEDHNNKEPSNKNVESQQRLFSTKKKRTSKYDIVLKKPTSTEAANILKGLGDPEHSVVNIHTGDDHTYY
jgi:hypothetical protein